MWQTYSQHCTNREKLNRNKTRVSILSTFIQYIAWNLRAIRQERELKEMQMGKKEVKLSLLTEDMILYLNNPKEATKKPLFLINTFSKIAGYKINI
jgi:hypothetical protein